MANRCKTLKSLDFQRFFFLPKSKNVEEYWHMVKTLCLGIDIAESENEEFRIIHTMQLSPERLYFGID